MKSAKKRLIDIDSKLIVTSVGVLGGEHDRGRGLRDTNYYE